MSLLNSQFTLLDIRDVESFTGRIVERSGLRLSLEDREDLHVYLIEDCWQLSLVYDRGDPRYASNFSGWAMTRLRHLFRLRSCSGGLRGVWAAVATVTPPTIRGSLG